MQFKNPQLLYALFLLIIPIIVHLFQLRKFQNQAFTNVAFLKKVNLQTRKSAQLKKWLTLLVRLGLLAAIILAFAQPYTSKINSLNTSSETVIYLDNSFSMQAKGEQGELLKRAIQQLVRYVPENEKLALLTNNSVYKNTTLKAIKNDVLQLDYSSNQLPYTAALLKSKKLFSKQKNTIKNIVFISDFQQKNTPFSNTKDTLYNLYNIQLKPVNNTNVAIDSAYISKRGITNLELTVSLKNSGTVPANLPLSLYNNSNLLSKTAVNLKTKHPKAVFTIPTNTAIKGKITIDDPYLKFDNNLFFSINKALKINILTINDVAPHNFLKRIFTNNEFNYSSTLLKTLNYNTISNQNLIVLNELKNIPNALTTALLAFTENGGHLIVIPSNSKTFNSYNDLLQRFGFSPFKSLLKSEKRLTTINFSHPIYNDNVFEKKVTNFQYPKMQSYYSQNLKNASAVLQFEDGKPLLSQRQNTYVFTSALNMKNTNFQNSPLIVPTFYSIAKSSLKYSQLYYTIGKNNTYDVPATLQKNTVLELVNGTSSIIPKQEYFNTKITITTDDIPDKAANYTIKNKAEIIQNVSYNYNRNESVLHYLNLDSTTLSPSIESVFDTIKSDTKINALWKWFVIFALLLLIVEMLILNYFK